MSGLQMLMMNSQVRAMTRRNSLEQAAPGCGCKGDLEKVFQQGGKSTEPYEAAHGGRLSVGAVLPCSSAVLGIAGAWQSPELEDLQPGLSALWEDVRSSAAACCPFPSCWQLCLSHSMSCMGGENPAT